MKFSGKISITRDSRDMINIRITDDPSRTEFIDVHMSLEDFAFAITGLSSQTVTGDVRGLDRIGKERIREARSILQPVELQHKSREVVKEWFKLNCQEEGWILDTHLGSQNSFQYDGKGNTTINYSVYKYVDVNGETE